MFLNKALHPPSFTLLSKTGKQTGGEGKSKFIHFITTCPESWGGSEELWSRTALDLAARDFHVTANFVFLDQAHPEVLKLVNAGMELENYRGVPFIRRFSMFRKRWEHQLTIERLRHSHARMAVISQGENMDGRRQIGYCRDAGIPYVIICQKAGEDICPMDYDRPHLKESFNRALRVFFVSEHNRQVTEERLGMRLTNAEVVFNPFKVDYNVQIPWPEPDQGRFHIACVARLWLRDKGQDILLKILAQDKWKKRDLEVHFYGLGPNEEALKEMTTLLGVTQVRFCGFSPDVTDIWREHHALILPSRHEGLPLALVEAMLCGRPAIATDAGGNAEILENEISGFIAKSISIDSVDEAMERAWNRRHEWQKIGADAAKLVRAKVPANPSALFTEKIIAIYDKVVKAG